MSTDASRGPGVAVARPSGPASRGGAPLHSSGVCAAGEALARLDIAEIALLVDSLSPSYRQRLRGAAGVLVPVHEMAPALRDRVPTLDADGTHEVAGWLVQPMTPGFSRSLELGDEDPGRAVRDAVGALFGEWPPGAVTLLIELAWEVGELPSPLLDRDALARAAGELGDRPWRDE